MNRALDGREGGMRLLQSIVVIKMFPVMGSLLLETQDG